MVVSTLAVNEGCKDVCMKARTFTDILFLYVNEAGTSAPRLMRFILLFDDGGLEDVPITTTMGRVQCIGHHNNNGYGSCGCGNIGGS
jgi:hypothetical protein